MLPIAAVLQLAVDELRTAGVPDPQVDAEWLMAQLLNCRRGDLYTNSDQILTPESIAHFRLRIRRRLRREPLQYILGYEEFYGHRFTVTPAVLIPRPETEQLIDLTLPFCERPDTKILDIGTGSGCIAITLALACPHAKISAVDLSVDALRITRDNARNHGVDGRIRLLAADLFHDDFVEPFDVIVSNPPYVEASQWHEIQPEVRNFEPVQALVAGNDGLDIIRRLIADSPRYLRDGGHLLIEFGKGQQDAIQHIVRDSGAYAAYSFHQDLNNVVRFIHLVK